MELWNITKFTLFQRITTNLRCYRRLPFSKTLFIIAATHNWFLKQLNFDNAFLHKDLYMIIPHRIKTYKENQVCKLKKVFL